MKFDDFDSAVQCEEYYDPNDLQNVIDKRDIYMLCHDDYSYVDYNDDSFSPPTEEYNDCQYCGGPCYEGDIECDICFREGLFENMIEYYDDHYDEDDYCGLCGFMFCNCDMEPLQ